jgi:hypothetical protein
MCIMTGALKPEEEFGQAAIAADHTGEENQIADLLSALTDQRDVELSLRNLELLLLKKPLEPKAQQLLEKRYQERAKAFKIAREVFTSRGQVYFAKTDEEIDVVLLQALMPNAAIIILSYPRINDKTGEKLPGYEVKVRLGLAAPQGADIREIMKEVDFNFAGRWNAGNNGRRGGTQMDFNLYVNLVEQSYNKYLGK